MSAIWVTLSYALRTAVAGPAGAQPPAAAPARLSATPMSRPGKGAGVATGPLPGPPFWCLERRDVEQPLLDAVRILRRCPVGGAGRLQAALHTGRGCGRVRGLVERGTAGNVWGGHRRAGDRVVPLALPGRQDAHAGRDDVDVGTEVREIGERVILVGAAGRCGTAAR